MPAGPDIDTAWADPAWAESTDSVWQAQLRQMQARWRAERLGLPPGPFSATDPSRLVSSTLPLDAPRDANFLTADVAAAVERRLATVGGGLVKEDRLRRFLLSSQPMCFNLFGNFQTADRQQTLLPWVQSINPAAVDVVRVEVEWAPPAAEHFSGGSAFDAFVEYQLDAGGLGFVGVECKYHEDLVKSDVKRVRDVYKTFTVDSGLWQHDAGPRLDVPGRRQLWLNTLLAQSLASRDRYSTGQCVVTACAADTSPRSSFDAVRCELVDRSTMVWSPWELILDTISGHDAWRADFQERYLAYDLTGSAATTEP